MNIVDISVKRPVTIWMFTFAVLLFGMVSLGRLSVNLLPELSYPTLTIRSDYIGAAPVEVEQLVTKPIEEALGIVKGVRNMHSVSKAGQSDVVLEFEWGTDMDIASLEVREKLDVIQLPLDISKPVLLKFNPNLDPIIRLALKLESSESSGSEQHISELKQLREYADEELKRKLESIAGVASVRLGGGLEKEIHVLINQDKASQLGISEQQVVSRLRAENLNQSGGRVQDGNQEYLVRTINKFKSLEDINDVYIATVNGTHIKLSDIATIDDSFKERDSITRVNGIEAIEVSLYKEGDANTVEVANKVKQRLGSLNKQLPSGYSISSIYDQSGFITSAIDEVKSAAIIGGLLSMLILFFFLKNIWTTLIVSISIPVSVIATFNLMYGNDISLNIMSLGGIALAVGLLVDNAIVVLENIARHKELNPDDANVAAKGTKEVASAIFASTLTTMAVFFPLVFVEGIAGQLFSDQALTVTFALMASLVVALTLIPMLAAKRQSNSPLSEPKELPIPVVSMSGLQKVIYFITWPLKWLFSLVFYYLPLGISILASTLFLALRKLFSFLFKPLLWLFDLLYNALNTSYQKSLSIALQQKALVFVFIIIAAGASLPLIEKLNVELIPSMSQGEFYVEINHQPGTALEVTDNTLVKLTALLNENPNIDRTYTLAGTGSLLNASPAQGGDYWGRINVVMKSGSTITQEKEAIENIRNAVDHMAGLNVKIGKPELFSFKNPLSIELAAYDLTMLKQYSEQLVDKLADDPMFVDVKTSLQSGHPEIKVYFNHAKLAQLGLSAPEVAKLIASKIGGDIASQYSIRDRKVDILVRVDEKARNSIADISSMIVNPNQTQAIPLSAVAEVVLSVGPSEITRIDQQRVAVVSANLAFGDLKQAAQRAQSLLDELAMPVNVQASLTGQNEEMDVSFTSLKFALALAIFLVYLVMASQFESLLHPLLILFSVPLAGAGTIYGLYLTGTPISVIVFIGLIMLAGIVVNNAIVLVDRINQLRAEGIDKTAAIKEAAINRFRPILMTTLTTTLGLLPLAIGSGDGAEIRAPMAISVIFGLAFATVLTLYFIPLLYSVFDRKKFTAEQS